MKVSASEATAYAGSAVSLGGAMTLTQWGVLIGIFTALATFALNAWMAWSKRQDEHEEHVARMSELKARTVRDVSEQRAADAPRKTGRIHPISAATPKGEPEANGG